VETRRKGKILLYLKLDPKQVEVKSAIFRDVSKIGHYGTGDVELTISSDKDFEKAKPIIQQAYENVGG
jgi:predicted transport protein